MFTGKENEEVENTYQTISVNISGGKQIGIAKWQASRLAEAIQFSQDSIEKITVIIDELAKNLIHHAHNAEIRQLLFQSYRINNRKVFDMVALDNGQGVSNLDVCEEENYLTEEVQENGFGKIIQLADYFKVYTQHKSGVISLTSIYQDSQLSYQNSFTPPHSIGGICLPIPIEKANGDNWSYHQTTSQSTILLADGLGHGPEAAIASRLACKGFQDNADLNILQIIAHINTTLRGTVGAVIAIAQIDNSSKQVRFAGLGNILGHIYHNAKLTHLTTDDGTAGYTSHKSRELIFPWHDNAILIMHSDGLASRWELTNYQNLTALHPTLLASLLYRDHYRGKDDVTVVVAKNSVI